MADHNLIALPRSLANESTPIVINNACVSWHRLALNFSFGGARAYVGTLFPITPMEAQSVVERMLDKHFGKPLAVALWAAQRDVYGETVRRPYVLTGVFPQHLRAGRGDAPTHIARRLMRGLVRWRRYAAAADPKDEKRARRLQSYVTYFERELEWFRKKWDRR